MTPWQRYREDLADPAFVYDAAQERAVRRLQDLYERLLAAEPRPEGLKGWWRWVRGVRPEPERGLYLWGGVGRGKTYLVDTFFECLPFPHKRRLHFHRFMSEVHARLKMLRDRQDPLRLIARDWAEGTRVLCFDEFFVSDIADAMMLGGLLTALFKEGVTLVATSNIPPQRLYHDGLQRERFLPAIELLQRHAEVLNVDGGTDYRLRFLERAEIYHVPLDAAGDRVLAEDFEHLCPDGGQADVRLTVEGRSIWVRRLGDGVAWFDFEQICDGPRGQADYIEVARRFHTVLLSNVPIFDGGSEDRARRFISLVDEFYDRRVKLVVSAHAVPERLYRGRRLAFEFERTASRLTEMQSREYLSAAHRP